MPSLDEPPQRGGDRKAEARAAEAAAIRRRWITLGEVLTLAAVVISGLTLWNSWNERRDSEAVRQADARRSLIGAVTLVLTAAPSTDRGKLVLKPASDEQSVQGQTISFPQALAAAPAETTGEPRIEAAWFERALKKARGKTGLPDDSRGDERLPVAIVTRFLVDGEAHTDVALYDVGYSIAGGWLGGHSVTLRGIALVSRVRSGSAQAALDARWAKLFPPK